MNRRVLTIVAHELRRRLRNRSALITAFVAPLALALVFGLLIGGASSSSFTIGVTDEAKTTDSAALVTSLTSTDGGSSGGSRIEFEAIADRATATKQVDDDDVGAAIVITSSFGGAGTGAPLVVLRNPSRSVSGEVATAVATSIASKAATIDLAIRTAIALGSDRTPTEIATAAQAAPEGVQLDLASTGDGVDPQAFYGAAMAMVFLFFTLGFAGRSVLAERRNGTLSRVLASPTTAAEVLLGKTLAVSLLALAGFVTVWLVTSLGFDAHWGPPAQVLAVVVATVLAMAGVSLAVAAFAKTEPQADALTSAVTFTLALLGGNFVGPNAPDLLRKLSSFTPNGWALHAFEDLSAGTALASRIATSIAVLLGFAVVFGGIGVRRLHRSIAPGPGGAA